MPVILSAEHVSRFVDTPEGKLQLLEGVSFSVDEGDTLAIVGASGSGKSTLLGILAGLDNVSTGDVKIRGQSLAMMSEDQRAVVRAREIGFVFQNFQLLPALTALENVMLPLELRHIKNCQAQAAQLLEQVGLGSRMQHYPRQLSGGEQQRVAIARAFVTHPALLFADEPTGNLDTHTANVVEDLLFTLNREQRATLVLVTHDERLAARCQRQLHLTGGRVAEAVMA